MTAFSEHTYTAELIATGGNIDLSMDEDSNGGISFDAGRVPHVEGQITLAVEDATLLDDLDPRDSRRVLLKTHAEFASGTEDRSFNLGIRRTVPDRGEGTVTLYLASDEAILSERAQLVDDPTPRTHEASLRSVCNYVLGKIGAAMQPGAIDANVTAYWAATNVLPDPACTSSANFASGGNAAALGTDPVEPAGPSPLPGGRLLYWSSQGSGQSFVELIGQPSVRVGDTWTLQVYMRRGAGAGSTGRLRLYELDQANAIVRTVESTVSPLKEGEWTLHSLTVTVQNPSAVKIKVYASSIATGAGQIYALTAPMLHKGSEVIPPFSGGANATTGYITAWNGAANASASTRTPLLERRPEALVWRAGVSGMAFLHPLLLATGLRLVCDEQRRWTLRSEDYRAEGAQAWRYAVNIETADEQLSRDDDSWFDGAVYEYVWTDSDGLEQRRVDTWAITATPSKVIRRELRDTPYPGPGRAQHVVERAQGKGRTVTVTGIPLWTENTDQALSILLDGTPIQTGIAATVAYDFSADTVTISSRTTDTPAGAIDLLPGTINALPGTINAL